MYTYSSEHGWGTLASTLDDTHKNLFDQLKALGFTQTEPEMLFCRAGMAYLYARYIPSGKKTPSLSFNFCCILAISGLLYIVGLKTLQDVFAFFKEIDAHPYVPQPISLADSERKEMQEFITASMDRAGQRVATVLNLAAWQKTIERLAQALETLSQQGATGQTNALRHPPLPSSVGSQQSANPILPDTHGISKIAWDSGQDDDEEPMPDVIVL